ncbi:GntR family transcriptional regulator [Streptomyces sp. NRRL F-5126]|uniref:GntR family transcriptional regulator n=1 Tax=Streptomyces sp. NRRL F-5126 TaxID=1463857 RepID=UPI0004CA5783|nr:GntR family transcriptional regulator [Streptomyces sp. NRRL F-5126]
MPDSGAVTRHTLRQQIADALRDEILAGRLLPGREFTVRTIAEQYGVSATPVREALVDLSAQGLLDSDQHKGFRVHRFSLADFREMVEARALLEDGVFRKLELTLAATADCPVLGPAAPKAGALVSVRRRAQEAARAARAGDVAILIGYDLRFWRELGCLGDNRYVSEFLDRMRVKSWVFAVPFLREDAQARRWLWSGHEEVVAAVSAGDAARSRALIGQYNDHLLKWADSLVRSSAEPKGASAGGAA